MTDTADALAAFVAVESLGETTTDPALVRSIRRRAARLTGVDLTVLGDRAAADGAGEEGDLDRGAVDVALEVAEQFVVDVAGIDDEQRNRPGSAFGADTFGLVQAIYVADYVPRVRWTLRELIGLDPLAVEPAGGDLWSALEEFMRTVARLDHLDPVLTELVRLRGARVHDCRLCRSLRNATAVAGGVDEGVADAVDRYEQSDLSDRSKVALRLTDAVIGRPGEIDAHLASAVLAQFDTDEVIELVLDVMRNAGNKIAVCLGADQAHVEFGVEYYDIDANGDPVYGLDGASGSP